MGGAVGNTSSLGSAPVIPARNTQPVPAQQAGSSAATPTSSEAIIGNPYEFQLTRDQWQAYAKVWSGANLKLEQDGKYEIKYGDSLYGIAKRLKDDYKDELGDKSLDSIVDALKQANPEEIKGNGNVILASTAKKKHMLDIAGTLGKLGVEKNILEKPAEPRGYYKELAVKEKQQQEATVTKVQKAIDEYPGIKDAINKQTFNKPEDYAAFYEQHKDEGLFKAADGNALFSPEEFKTWGEAQLAGKAESAAEKKKLDDQKSAYEKVDKVLQGNEDVPKTLRESLATAEKAGDVDYAKFYEDHDSEFAQLKDDQGNRLISKQDFVAYGKHKTELIQSNNHTDDTAGARPVKKYEKMTTAEKQQAFDHVTGKMKGNPELANLIKDQEQADKQAGTDTDYGALYDKKPSLFQQADITQDELRAYGEVKKQKADGNASSASTGGGSADGAKSSGKLSDEQRQMLREILKDLTKGGQDAIQGWIQNNGPLNASKIEGCFNSQQIQNCADLKNMKLADFKAAINDILTYSGKSELTLAQFQELRKMASA